VRIVRIFSAEDGSSRFADLVVETEARHVVDGVPPLQVSGPHQATGVTFVVQSADAADWDIHVAPRSQYIILLTGRIAVTVTDGERREFSPGDVLLAEDTTGAGHLSTPLTDDVTFVMIPTGL
jgi:quercetin dioxygenase-like cupin family protein